MNNDDIYIYLSNSATDYAKPESSHLGTKENPDVNFIVAFNRAKEIAAKYKAKNNGSLLTFHMLLYKGDHFVIRREIKPTAKYVDFYSSNYHMKITPLYCSLFTPADTTNCVNPTDVTHTVTINNKLGWTGYLILPKKTTYENIIFDYMEGIIPWRDDPGSCLTARKKC